MFVELPYEPPKNVQMRQLENVSNNANKLTFFAVTTVNCLFPSSLPKNKCNTTQSKTID